MGRISPHDRLWCLLQISGMPWLYGNNTFQKGASLLVIYNQSVTWTALRQLAMFSTTSSSTCTFWSLCMESFTYLCLFTTVVSYPISSPEEATLDKAFDKAIADAVPCSNSWQKLLISRWYILGGSKEREKNLSRSLEIAWMSSESCLSSFIFLPFCLSVFLWSSPSLSVWLSSCHFVSLFFVLVHLSSS